MGKELAGKVHGKGREEAGAKGREEERGYELEPREKGGAYEPYGRYLPMVGSTQR